MVGEGGNLGLTQLGRVEAALHGVRVNTDAIDNSAGVDCSDHEVNIKILLDRIVAAGDLTGKQRNELLAEMTDEVGTLVLRDNYEQNVLLGNARKQSLAMVTVHQRFMCALEARGLLDRELEFLPSDTALAERAEQGRGLTSPEFAVLVAYSKIALTEDLVASTTAGRGVVHPHPAQLLPHARRRALWRPARNPPAQARDHHHLPRQRDGEPRGHHLRLPLRGGDRAPTPSKSPAPTRRAERSSVCGTSSPRSRRSTTASTPTCRPPCT